MISVLFGVHKINVKGNMTLKYAHQHSSSVLLQEPRRYSLSNWAIGPLNWWYMSAYVWIIMIILFFLYRDAGTYLSTGRELSISNELSTKVVMPL